MTKDRIARERVKALHRLMKANFKGADKATSLALEEREKASIKSEGENRAYREGANEWRGSMNDRERNFMPRAESEKASEGQQDQLRRLEGTQIAQAGRGQGVGATVAIALAVLGGAVGVAGLVVAVVVAMGAS